MSLNRFFLSVFATAFLAASPVRAEVINLSCDNGGMLLAINTANGTVKDRNPFQNTLAVARLTETGAAFLWHESAPAVDYRLDKKTHIVTVSSGGRDITLSNPQCGKSAVLLPGKK